MAKRVTLNERRLTKNQVQELIDGGATLREDLVTALRKTNKEGTVIQQDLLYDLPNGNILWVFDPEWFVVGLRGRGDIWPLDAVLRVIRVGKQIDEDARAGRQSSVGNWAYYSAYKERLPSHAPSLIEELPNVLGIEPAVLDFSYASLDQLSARIDVLGHLAARRTAYDHLVAYVGEIMRRRTDGKWVVETRDGDPFPYILSAIGGKLMPINVVSGELMGMKPDLRLETANEVRRAQWDGRLRQSLGIPP